VVGLVLVGFIALNFYIGVASLSVFSVVYRRDNPFMFWLIQIFLCAMACLMLSGAILIFTGTFPS
jgi:hypothetical protein